MSCRPSNWSRELGRIPADGNFKMQCYVLTYQWIEYNVIYQFHRLYHLRIIFIVRHLPSFHGRLLVSTWAPCGGRGCCSGWCSFHRLRYVVCWLVCTLPDRWRSCWLTHWRGKPLKDFLETYEVRDWVFTIDVSALICKNHCDERQKMTLKSILYDI